MRTNIIVFASALVLFTNYALFSQDAAAATQTTAAEQGEESDLYVLTVPLEKVFLHNSGYAIKYRKGLAKTRMAYMPIDWFIVPPGNTKNVLGEVHQIGPGRVGPHISIFYRGAKIDHIKLYVRKEILHSSWGTIEPYASYDALFKDVTPENFKLELK